MWLLQAIMAQLTKNFIMVRRNYSAIGITNELLFDSIDLMEAIPVSFDPIFHEKPGFESSFHDLGD